jgi:hypothetical protein
MMFKLLFLFASLCNRVTLFTRMLSLVPTFHAGKLLVDWQQLHAIAESANNSSIAHVLTDKPAAMPNQGRLIQMEIFPKTPSTHNSDYYC